MMMKNERMEIRRCEKKEIKHEIKFLDLLVEASEFVEVNLKEGRKKRKEGRKKRKEGLKIYKSKKSRLEQVGKIQIKIKKSKRSRR